MTSKEAVADTVEDEDGNIGVSPDEDLAVDQEKREQGLLYVSKSRISKWMTCPRKFWFTYWTETRQPQNYYMTRGIQVHRAFEQFHENMAEYVRENGERPERFTPLLEDWRDFAQWVEMFGHFFAFEERRWQAAADSVYEDRGLWVNRRDAENALFETLERWEPIGVEVEGWLGEPPDEYERADPDHINPDDPPVGDIPWMGKADAILPTQSIPEIEGDGVVILDYKTGSVPDPQYRNEGIFLEGEYYGWLFEEFYDVDGVAGYYPREDELITSPYPCQERRWDIKRAVLGMQEPPDKENFPAEEQPLCHYGSGKCFFYDECESTWNE